MASTSRSGYAIESFDLALDAGGPPLEPVLVMDATSASSRYDDVPTTGLSPLILIADERTPPSVVADADIVLAGPGGRVGAAVEVAQPRAEADRLVEAIRASPRAALALLWLLREGDRLGVRSALAAESAVYSTLLAGPDFGRWLGARGPARAAGQSERVRVSRAGSVLRVTLARPDRRNAVDAAMRNALLEALTVARWDPDLTVEIDGEGPSFCAGGDLDEFGTASDPATAHLVRMTASVGRLLHELGDRVTVRVHGDCIGAGLELPAFAGSVIAAADARFQLPEVAMGLIPGAGGTVSLPRRIARSRTAWLAITGRTIDVRTAVSWGLVDRIE